MRGFIEELRHRNVIRVAIAYIVAGWLSAGSLLNRATLVALIVAVAWLGWDKLQRPIAEPIPTTAVETTAEDTAKTTDKSIAVLPFVNMSSDKEQEWFSDGLTEEILNALARTPDLLVAARTSSFKFKDSNEDIPTIAAELGVTHVLEGSVR